MRLVRAKGHFLFVVVLLKLVDFDMEEDFCLVMSQEPEVE